jgi:hypothetical protein
MGMIGFSGGGAIRSWSKAHHARQMRISGGWLGV